MARKRRAFIAVFKAKVALGAIKGLKTSAALAKAQDVHETQIAIWKEQLTDDASSTIRKSSYRLIPKILATHDEVEMVTAWERTLSFAAMEQKTTSQRTRLTSCDSFDL
jgi:hypothetical protein